MVGRDAACEKGGAGGGADGGDAEEIFETDAVGGDFVDIWRFEFVVSCASKGPGTLVVGDEYDNVWMIYSFGKTIQRLIDCAEVT